MEKEYEYELDGILADDVVYERTDVSKLCI